MKATPCGNVKFWPGQLAQGSEPAHGRHDVCNVVLCEALQVGRCRCQLALPARRARLQTHIRPAASPGSAADPCHDQRCAPRSARRLHGSGAGDQLSTLPVLAVANQAIGGEWAAPPTRRRPGRRQRSAVGSRWERVKGAQSRLRHLWLACRVAAVREGGAGVCRRCPGREQQRPVLQPHVGESGVQLRCTGKRSSKLLHGTRAVPSASGRQRKGRSAIGAMPHSSVTSRRPAWAGWQRQSKHIIIKSSSPG